ncbi:hypothetical protein Trydic_g7994 [Trypoxylus dichotomus]
MLRLKELDVLISKMSLPLRMKIFNSIAIPSATYGEEVWCLGSPKAQETVQKTEVILARKCAGAPWFIRNEDLRRELKDQDRITRAKRRREQAKERMKTHQAERIRKREEICEATRG